MAACDLPRYEHSLHLFLAGDFDPLLGDLPEHRHVGPGVAGCWIFFSFFISLGAGFLADAIAPIGQQGAGGVDPQVVLKNAKIQGAISLVSPMTLYSEATSTILDPMRKTTSSLILMGPLERISLSRFQSPLPLIQSLAIVTPHMVTLVAITLLCFGVCYAVFMRQEIRTI